MTDIDDLIRAVDNYFDARNELWERRRQLAEDDGYFVFPTRVGMDRSCRVIE